MLKLHVLASGSRGNAAVIENADTGEGVLVDCGISKKALFGRCEETGFDIRGLKAVFLTHDHRDHTSGLGVFYRGLKSKNALPPLYMLPELRGNVPLIDEVIENDGVPWLPLFLDEALEVAGLRVETFPTSHDALASCGFRFECDGDSIGYVTDTGFLTDEAFKALQGVRILALESNHDVKMLAEGPYPSYLKKRVGSERGHLSNDQAVAVLEALAHEGLEAVVAMHISQKNNTYRLPAERLRGVLDGIGSAAEVHVAWQDRALSIG